MCASGDEEESGASTSDSGSYSGGEVPEIVVTAPRITLDMDTINNIDWGEVLRSGAISAAGGSFGGVWGAVGGGLAGAAGEIEDQDDLENLFEIVNDLIVVPGLPAPNVPIY